MSWYIDWLNVKADSEELIQLEEKIKRLKELQKSQVWPDDTDREIRAAISRLETQLLVYKESA